MPAPSPDAPVATLPEPVRAFLHEPNYAALASLDSDGSPRQAVLWFALDGDLVLVNSRNGRRWPANLRRDARVALAVVDRTDPMRWVGLAGEVCAIDDDPARALADIQALSDRYFPGDAGRASRFEGQSRVTFRIRIRDVHAHLD